MPNRISGPRLCLPWIFKTWCRTKTSRMWHRKKAVKRRKSQNELTAQQCHQIKKSQNWFAVWNCLVSEVLTHGPTCEPVLSKPKCSQSFGRQRCSGRVNVEYAGNNFLKTDQSINRKMSKTLAIKVSVEHQHRGQPTCQNRTGGGGSKKACHDFHSQESFMLLSASNRPATTRLLAKRFDLQTTSDIGRWLRSRKALALHNCKTFQTFL
jgi:hypothetical protein